MTHVPSRLGGGRINIYATEFEDSIEYERDDLTADIEYPSTFPQAATASDLGLTERGWRKVIKGRSNPRHATEDRILRVAARYRLTEAYLNA